METVGTVGAVLRVVLVAMTVPGTNATARSVVSLRPLRGVG